MSQIWVHMIVGENEEPFLEPALRAVSWADGFSIVNTAPDSEHGTRNGQLVRDIIYPSLHYYQEWAMTRDRFDFALARNLSLNRIPDGAYALLVDADDVHYPEFEQIARDQVAAGHDMIASHFYHLAVYKDLIHSEPVRDILFTTGRDVYFQGGIHEGLVHPRENPGLAPGYAYAHYGYIKPAREVAARWEFYRTLGSTVHDYNRDEPDRALDDWPAICKPFWRAHPPAAQAVLETYPPWPGSIRTEKPVCGLVLLTWDDAKLLAQCLPSLATTTESFELALVDNGSTDESVDMVQAWAEANNVPLHVTVQPGLSLAAALNIGFTELAARSHLDYVGWIHPDMVFESATWLGELRAFLGRRPDVAKVGAQELHDSNRDLRDGNSQCYLIRKTALETAGLFNDRFAACGGYEDWEHNARLLKTGRVMIWPGALIRHEAMSTRSRHDNHDAARHNAGLYHELTGTWEPPV